MPEENGSAGPSALEAKVIKQVEYYFGDINLSRDKFLQAEIKTEDGWVALETMLKFNRLKQLTEEQSVIVEALSKSTSGLMEVSEDKTKIRRVENRPVPEFTQERKNDVKWRSVYAKGFPVDTPLDELLTYFNQFGDTEHVQMRRDNKREFKGSCMVIYAKEEAAKQFVKGDPIKFSDAELLSRLFKHEYFEKKTSDRKQDTKHKDDSVKQKEEEAQEEYVKGHMTTGAILAVSGLEATTSREDLKKAFVTFGMTVSWVDLNQGDTEGRLRFDSQDGASVALEKLKEGNDGKTLLGGMEVEAKVLEGDEELEHWKKLYVQQRDVKDKKRRKRDTRGGGKRGGYKGVRRGGGDRGRRPAPDSDGDSGDEGPAVKRAKPDSPVKAE